ncbi:MAG: ABC transporter ATP-binding protein [Candidatus Cloacimonetes bacterium]|nr:ABC transporter ATP-binding protein [Candidatus Cloacimonadota bacterium]
MIKTEELTRKFGDFIAVDHLNLQIVRGEIFGFLGANGAGKTTTIRMLCGLLMPSSGRIWVNNLDVAKEGEKVKKSIGYMSQRFSLYQDLKAKENLEFYAGVYATPRAEAWENTLPLLEQFGLKESLNMRTAELPMGYKQRLSLVCALVHNPPLVILDEPTSGVDPQARREFWQVINQLAFAGKTVLVSTHFMDEAEYCHRVIIMQAGKEVALGPPRELKQRFEVQNMQELFMKVAGGINAKLK